MSEKSQWGSKLGFILASAGSAIGLGAVWKFPYMTAANGGGGFLLVFLISTILIGFPLLLAEFALGRSAGVSAIITFGKLGKNNKYNFIGWIGAFALFILLSFYSVIGGWILVYLGIEFGKLFQLGGTGDYAQLFTSIISNPAIALGAQASFILLNIFIVSRGVQKGIERASKVMMPLLFIIFVVIIGRSLSLPNAMEGVLYFLKPDFSKLTSAGLLYALGQSFFALSLGGYSYADLCFLLGQENQSGPVRYFHRSHEHLGFHHGGTSHFPSHVSFQYPVGRGTKPALYHLASTL
ncbi:Sodium-dependent transporter [Streptococcus oralis]|uniref:Transporter n=1 Tax=Streptococcus oralis TaxID=1303 RepID=A0A139Q7F1_STROR|nr:Sodium-dependent transporter [Streptococcus oralis]